MLDDRRGAALAESAAMMRSLPLVIAALLGGCNLYFGGGDDQCELVGDGDIAPSQQVRDPFTGECQSFGGGFPCDSRCGGCPDIAALSQAIPDWGTCFSECEALDETSCIGASSCRAAYTNSAFDDGPPTFHGCWAVAPSGPVQGGGCDGLDAYECSRHDDCSAYYNQQLGPDDGVEGMLFAVCKAENGTQGCFGDEECGTGAHCSTSDGECLPPPGCDPDNGQACPAVCYGKCVLDQDSCTNVDCGPGSHCEEQCQGAPGGTCNPVCVPDQDSCSATTCPQGYDCVQKCDGQDPNNPGCGVCTTECVPAGTCEGIQTEAECAARGGCTTVYQGESCTCYPNGGCDCEILTYERCESL